MPWMRRPDTRGVRRAGAAHGARAAAPLAAALLVSAGLTIVSLTPGEAHAAAGRAASAEDFNGDGYADLVTAAPGATVSGKGQAGYVAVTYGSAKGLDPANRKVVSRSTSGVPGSAAAKQRFGSTFSKGDLDGDGYSDLVIGSTPASAGSVVVWGSSSGLTGGTAVAGYGQTPQVGDFDGDGKADLALFGDAKVEGDDPVQQAANLWKGPVSRAGKPAAVLDFLDRSEWWGYNDDDAGCATDDSCVDGPHSLSGPTTAESVGDVNGDRHDDIAVWAYEGDGVWGNHVLLGGAHGFRVSATLGDIGSVGGDGATDIGDVDGDGYGDVVIGSDDDTGKVTVLYGSASGPSTGRVSTFDQTLPGFYGAQEEGDHVGSCVSVADVTGDGRAEIALGIRGEDFGGLTDAGSFALLHGTASGVTGEGSQVMQQNTSGVPGVAEKGDKFGAACALLDVNGDGHLDLAVSSTGENASAGAVWTLNGTGKGLTATRSTAFGPGDVGGPVSKALFGSFLR
ncbi:FG-GAP repeat protein [Streptomyces sp. RKAG290]|uniref:FG-GAP repeat protein n=1 Tax=Streptomyces sp. RKAG290 TaxID=2888348 RepID=UPI002034425E|nr:FG-GAP repeat protein [Streptomyces sp. RKAG290]MCM2416119.1 FG-GAP-like repeat-containing protein [Streptomyces sp. RKAG290]